MNSTINSFSDSSRPVFHVQRVVSSTERVTLADEISQKVLRFYTSGEGQKLLNEEDLASDNRDKWRDIQQYVYIDPRWTSLVVRDENQKLQAVALVGLIRQSPYLWLEALATVPQNLGKKGKNRGAGTAAFAEAVSLCKENQHPGIELRLLKSSEPFYKKLDVQMELNQGLLLEKDFATFLGKYGK